MKLNLITFFSSLNTSQQVKEDHKELLERMEHAYDINYITPEELGNFVPEGPTMVLVASGGVEELVKAQIDKLPQLVLLVADGLNNSLAASLEILSWMRQNGRRGRVIHGSLDEMMETIDHYARCHEAIGRLMGQRVGVIGKPSGWLIASSVGYEDIARAWGIEMVDLPLDEVVKRYEAVTNDEVQQLTDDFMARATAIKEPSRDEIVKAMRLYVAVKQMVEHYRLNAFTLNCFDLIPTTRTTGCVALALLNEAGIPAGCEGDMQTLLTMLAVNAATGQPTFMANPSQILNLERHEIVLAHCTIAPSMTDQFIIRDHYESRSGVGIEGIIEPGVITVAKCGTAQMKRYFVSKAQLLRCTSHPTMCRTQFYLQMEAPLNYFLENSIGNHHVIVRGDHTKLLNSLFIMLGAKAD